MIAKKAAAPAIKPRHFSTTQAFGDWLDKNHRRAPERRRPPDRGLTALRRAG
ncbi:MAG TPA: hypothetical protein VFU71_00025 [Burkholderiaceae bacterium]|nr:hypothetical protein [Burkholderiaceae bacterium]